MYECACAYVNAHAYGMCMPVQMYVCDCIHADTGIFVHEYMCKYICVIFHVYEYVHTQMYICAHLCACV